MKFILSSLLLTSLCAISSRSVSSPDTCVVTQSPDVSAMEGDTVNITCCWMKEFERMRVYWLKNQTNIKHEVFHLENLSQGSLQKKTSACSKLTIAYITRNSSGRYTCKVSVEIPLLCESEGKGTVITVVDRDYKDYNTEGDPGSYSLPLAMTYSLAVVAPLLFITLTYFFIQRRRQAQAARVIYEVPHIDSEEADMDKHSTSSSRGSSQWCQVPVYESFDYFERVQTKESG